MTTLTELRKLAEAAIDEQKIPACDLPVYAFRRHKSDLNTACSPERILAMIAVIEAAKAMRDAGVDLSGRCIEPPYMSEKAAVNEFIGIFDGPLQRDFDAALARLQEQSK